MTKFGKVAVEATGLLTSAKATDPRDAWDSAAKARLGYSKHCPRNAYVGLCEEGLVKGVQPGRWLTSDINKSYAVKAVQALREDPAWLKKKTLLWRKVSAPSAKVPNGQLDVVFGLWEEGLITN